jgi:hypothetical protein
MEWADVDRKRRRANLIIADRFPEIDGVLYFAVKYKVHQAESAAFETFLGTLAEKWPSIRFFKLDRDPVLDDWEVTMLRNVLDMLPDDESA